MKKLFVLLLCVCAPALLLSGCMLIPKKNTGLQEGRLKDCPSYPRCVSSQSKDASHFIEPLSYEGSYEDIFELARRVILEMEYVALVSEEERYLHFEFKTKIWRFTDDVELFFDTAEKVIHFRSASRVGYYDFGTNRNRVEKIKAAIRAHMNAG